MTVGIGPRNFTVSRDSPSKTRVIQAATVKIQRIHVVDSSRLYSAIVSAAAAADLSPDSEIKPTFAGNTITITMSPVDAEGLRVIHEIEAEVISESDQIRIKVTSQGIGGRVTDLVPEAVANTLVDALQSELGT